VKPGFGVALPPTEPVSELAAIARDAEDRGCTQVWVNDERLERDPFVVLSAIAKATDKIELGPGVTNPYSRHPALIATAVATLDELSGGRAVLGLGAGGTNHRALGIERKAPVSALREALTLIRALLAGETLTVDGRVVHANEASLDFDPPRADLPLHVGARGPKVLEMAGALADGIIVGNLATPAGWRYALERIEAGARSAKRELGDLRLTSWLYASVDDDPDAARDAVRHMVATSLTTSRPILDALKIEMPPAFAEAMERRGWSLAADAVREAGRELPNEVIGAFSVAGTPGECRAAVTSLLRDVPAIDQVVLVPFAPRGSDLATTVQRLVSDVAAPAVADRVGAEV
jgi:5,10-methylenetetrahydromethanopterin reductase